MTMLDVRPVQDQLADPALLEPDRSVYYFTFGEDHRLMISSSWDGKCYGAGLSLGRRFVRIPGTFASARHQFMVLFGASFCDQYEEARGAEIVARYKLTELVVSDA